MRGGGAGDTVSKTIVPPKCHSERSEESSIFRYLDPSLTLRVTEKIGFETVPGAFPPYDCFAPPEGQRGPGLRPVMDAVWKPVPANYLNFITFL